MKRIGQLILSTLLAASIALSPWTMAQPAEAKDLSASTVNSVLTEKAPKIDGVWDSKEWGEPAVTATFSYQTDKDGKQEEHAFAAYLRHDKKYLYIAMTLEDDDFGGKDQRDVMEIHFDNNNNGKIDVNETIKSFWNLTFENWQYKGNGSWSKSNKKDGSTGKAGHSNQKKGNRIGDYVYEVKIPLSLFPKKETRIAFLFSEMSPDRRGGWAVLYAKDGWPEDVIRFDGATYAALRYVDSATQPEKELKSLEVDEQQKNIAIKTGESAKIGLWAVYADNSREDVTQKATWTSSNPKVATVEKGLVTAIKEGSATIQATYEKKTVSIPVRVEEGTNGQPDPTPTGTTYPFQDGIDSSVPAFIDLRGGELVFEGKRFTFTLNLRDMPESLPFQQKGVEVGSPEYEWLVKLEDTDSSYKIGTIKFKQPWDDIEEDIPLEYAAQTDVWEINGNSSKRLYPVGLSVDPAGNQLVIAGDVPEGLDLSALKHISVNTYHTNGTDTWVDTVTVK
jgi:hypothetical protein